MADGTGRLLLTVSGIIPDGLERDVEIGRRPRPDYVVLASALEADLVDFVAARQSCGFIGRFIERIAGPAVLLAWYCYRHRRQHPIVFTDSEGVGLPYAALTWFSRRRPRHVMIGHRLSARKKVIIQHLLQLRRRVDDVIVYSTAQREFAADRLRYRQRQVHLTPFMVDTSFWQPTVSAAATADRAKICAVGQELRDYPTLMDAVRTLDVDVVVAAASPWSKRDDTSAGLAIP
ncbi:MAG: glycosyltransferase family 4 protein, partial [Ilumatobacteraceae bacterium]